MDKLKVFLFLKNQHSNRDYEIFVMVARLYLNNHMGI